MTGYDPVLDANKPITAGVLFTILQQFAQDMLSPRSEIIEALGYTPADAADLGEANGIATLGADAKLTSAQIPSIQTIAGYTPSNSADEGVANGIATLGNDAKLSTSQIPSIQTVAGYTPADSADIGVANGIAELDSSGKVPASQLPSYVDDVIEVASYSSLPANGESGKIYVTTDTNLTYRWSGASYVEISQSLALGETSSTAYRGDRGKIAYDHANAAGSAFTNGLYKITTNSEGHVTNATAVSKSDIVSLGIPEQDTTYGDATTSSKGLMTTDQVTKLNGISQGAEVNQNAFSNIAVGSTTIAADGKTDTLTLTAGSNITLTPDATNDKVTIAATDTTYSSKSAASGGTDVSLVTTGEKYTWNNKSNLALGTTSSTAYRGDYGNAAYSHAVTNKGSAFSSGLYKITTNAEGHVTAATPVAASDITALTKTSGGVFRGSSSATPGENDIVWIVTS